MRHAIRLTTRDNQTLEFTSDAEQTLLEAATEAGLSLPSSCREGTCGSCKALCHAGNYLHEPYSQTALSESERQQGAVLLCRTRAGGDLDLRVDTPASMISAGPVPEGECVIAENTDIGGAVRRLRLTVAPDGNGALQACFEPGQYAELNIPGTATWRSYSMSNAPNWSGEFEFLVRRKPGGAFSEWLATGATPGTRLRVRGPQGSLTLTEGTLVTRVLLGGGTGLAPLLSMLRNMADLGDPSPVRLYFGVTTEAELFALDELRELQRQLPQLRTTVCVWKDNEGWSGYRGSIGDALREDAEVSRAEAASSWDVYVCGPPAAVEAITRVASDVGVPRDRLHVERFA